MAERSGAGEVERGADVSGRQIAAIRVRRDPGQSGVGVFERQNRAGDGFEIRGVRRLRPGLRTRISVLYLL